MHELPGICTPKLPGSLCVTQARGEHFFMLNKMGEKINDCYMGDSLLELSRALFIFSDSIKNGISCLASGLCCICIYFFSIG